MHPGAWVSRLKQTSHGQWEVITSECSMGCFDYVIVAHNGKCANRLSACHGMENINKVLVKLRLSSIWMVAIQFQKGLELPFAAAFVQAPSGLSFICNQQNKFVSSGRGECWVLLSTAEYGKRNKVPQEFIPEAKGKQVTDELLSDFAAAIGLARGRPPIFPSPSQVSYSGVSSYSSRSMPYDGWG